MKIQFGSHCDCCMMAFISTIGICVSVGGCIVYRNCIFELCSFGYINRSFLIKFSRRKKQISWPVPLHIIDSSIMSFALASQEAPFA